MADAPQQLLPPHLRHLEAEAISILWETASGFRSPVLLYSTGKDSSVLLHLAQKAFAGRLPFPLLHIATGWDFRAVLEFRDRRARDVGAELLVHTNPDGVALNISPLTHGSDVHMRVMATEALRQAIDRYGFDAAIGGARRDEEKSRAKERIFSRRGSGHAWDPRQQQPELWTLYNTRLAAGETMRVFPLSNWTELDVWHYIRLEAIPIVPLYLAAERAVIHRHGTLIMRDDDRLKLAPHDRLEWRRVRFRTLGDWPLTGAHDSDADTIEKVIAELGTTRLSERHARLIDHDQDASMERRKRDGYF